MIENKSINACARFVGGQCMFVVCAAMQRLQGTLGIFFLKFQCEPESIVATQQYWVGPGLAKCWPVATGRWAQVEHTWNTVPGSPSVFPHRPGTQHPGVETKTLTLAASFHVWQLL